MSSLFRRRVPDLASFQPVLQHWNLTDVRVTRSFPGGGFRCILACADGTYFLRQSSTGVRYLDYQVRVLEHLVHSGFPYAVPAPIPTSDGSPYLTDESGHWLLYRFLAGSAAPRPFTRARAREVATIVAHYHRALASLELGEERGYFRLPLLDGAAVTRTLEEGARWLAQHRRHTRLARALSTHLDAVLREIDAGTAHTAAVAGLQTRTAYNDWHRRNMIARRGRVVALIDFDSIVEAPRVVDVQNALTWLLVSTPVPRGSLVSEFADTYGAIVPLAPDEARLLRPIMLDRITWLVADIVDHVRRDGADARAALATRLIRLCAWIAGRGEVITTAFGRA